MVGGGGYGYGAGGGAGGAVVADPAEAGGGDGAACAKPIAGTPRITVTASPVGIQTRAWERVFGIANF